MTKQKVIRWTVLYADENLKRDAHSIIYSSNESKKEVSEWAKVEGAQLIRITLEVVRK